MTLVRDLVSPFEAAHRGIEGMRLFALQFIQIEWSAFTPTIWMEFSFVIVCTTFFAYLLNIYGLKNLNPSTVSTYIYLQPLIAASFAIWSGKDNLDWIKIVAALLIFTGVYFVSKSKSVKSR